MNTKKSSARILSVKIAVTPDTDPDTSFLGRYTDVLADRGAIVRATGEFYADVRRRENIIELCALKESSAETPERAAYWRAKGERLAAKWADVNRVPKRSREYRFFVPYAGGEKPFTPGFRKCAKQNFERMESLCRGDWCFLCVRAEAEVVFKGSKAVQSLSSGCLCGVKSDAGDCFEEVTKERKAELSRILEAAGFSGEDVNSAFDNVETVYK